MEEQATELTIDELARESGMTARNIRAHQSRGLLPPPVVRSRTGYYGPEHVARIRLIQDMQAQGFNLKSIERLLELGAGGGSQEALEFERALLQPFGTEEAEVIAEDELAETFGAPIDREADREGGEDRRDPPDRRGDVGGALPHPAAGGPRAGRAGYPAQPRPRRRRARSTSTRPRSRASSCASSSRTSSTRCAEAIGGDERPDRGRRRGRAPAPTRLGGRAARASPR